MKRWILSTVIILISIASSMMTVQWKHYSNESQKEEIWQKITIAHHAEFFYIEQEVNGIDEGKEMTIHQPNVIEDFTCDFENGGECKEEQDQTFQLKSDGSKLRFSYVIPSGNPEEMFILEDWFIKLEGVSITHTDIQLSDAIWREGSWLIGPHLVAKRNMEYSDYYLFESINSLPPLYWQKQPFTEIYTNEDMSVYVTNDQVDSYKSLTLLSQSEIRYTDRSVIIYNEKAKQHTSDYMQILNQPKEMKQLYETIVKNEITTNIHVSEQNKWLQDVLISAFLNKPIGTEKTKAVFKELQKTFNHEQLTQWIKQLMDLETPITAVELDQYLPVQDGKKVIFFSENEHESDVVTPIQLISTKKIIINEQEAKETYVIEHNGQSFIQLESFATKLGYQVKERELGTLSVSKSPIHYYFFPNERIFQLNDERYGVDEIPVIQIHGKNYLSFDVLPVFFNVTIQEDKENIYITNENQ